MSLVAYYSDSDDGEDNSDDKEESCLNISQKGEGPNEANGSPNSTSKHETTKSSLLLSGGGSGTSESDSDDEDVKPKKRNVPGIKLDNPFRAFGGATSVAKEDSVFRNPFRETEDKKIAVLERHVKMTENPENALMINGKKICWNYRKRKCYLGTKCPYAHDSDVPLTDEQLQEQKVEEDLHRQAAGSKFCFTPNGSKTIFTPKPGTHLPGTASTVAGGYDSSAFYSSPHLSGGAKTDTDASEVIESSPNKSKKRVGLTNSLIPPKKALNLYQKTKDT